MAAEVQRWSDSGLNWPEQDEAANRARAGFAELTGFNAADVALVQSVAEAVGTVAASLSSAEVVIGSQEYRSLLFPWLNQPGVSVREVEMRQGQLTSAAVVAAITPRTDVVAVSWVQSASGSRIDLRPVRARCDEVGAKLLVDGTQGVGILEFHRDGRPDFLAAHGYKWLLAPRGAAWLGAAPEHSGLLRPLAPSNKSAPDSWCQFYGGPLELRADCSRLDSSLSWPCWAGAEEAISLMRSLPAPDVESHCLQLATVLRSELRRMNWHTVPTELPSHIVSFRHSDLPSLATALAAGGVQLTVRSGLARVGLHYFNDEQDLEVLLRILAHSRRG